MAERLPRPAVVAAWSSAVFVAGGFGLAAGVPIAVTAVGVFRADRLRPLRPWVTAALAALGAGTVLAYHVLSYRRRRN